VPRARQTVSLVPHGRAHLKLLMELDAALLLDGFRQPPKRDAAGRVKHLAAPLRGDGKYGARLRKGVRAGESAAESGCAQAAELSVRVPPSGDVHLAKPTHDKPQLQKAVQVKHRYRLLHQQRKAWRCPVTTRAVALGLSFLKQRDNTPTP
jgi:hypothetical protein